MFDSLEGLYAESHGIVGNYMYDFTRNESFLVGLNPEQYNAHWWNDGDPIWVTATRQASILSEKSSVTRDFKIIYLCYIFHYEVTLLLYCYVL